MERSDSFGYLPLSSRNSTETVSSDKLFQLIFALDDKGKLKSVPVLIGIVNYIIQQVKSHRAENKISQITSICYKNDKLKLLSKVLRQNFFSYQEENSTQVNEVAQENVLSNIPELNKLESAFSSSQQFQEAPITISSASFSLPSFGSLESGAFMQKLQHSPKSKKSQQEYFLRVGVIKLFFYLLVNQKMCNYVTNLQIPFYVYLLLLGPEGKKPDLKLSCLKRVTQKGLKFIYQYIKISKTNIPKIYCYYIKNLLNQYFSNEEDFFTKYPSKKQRIQFCFYYVLETAVLIIKKNLGLAAQCGVLDALFHKCMQGALQINRVETITQLIINYCIEAKTRRIIHLNIDLGKTFAIFTNVDKIEWISQRNSLKEVDKARASYSLLKNKSSVEASCVMIEMYLSHWPTLLYFLQQKKTLTNFISSLKRKEDKEIQIIEEIIFTKIVMRCMKYNRKKLIKSNNIFSSESNYLILRSLILLNFFNSLPDFRQLVIGGNKMPKFREYYIDVMLDYFTLKEEVGSRMLIGNMKSITYYKRNTFDLQKYGTNKDQTINNNIESFCSESLLPFQFNYKQLKYYLNVFIDILEDEQIKDKAKTILEQFLFSQKKGGKLSTKDILDFYQVAHQSCKLIPWKADYLHISKYISGVTGHLLQYSQKQQKLGIIEICRKYLRQSLHSQKQNYFHFLSINLLDDIGRYFASDAELINEIRPNIVNLSYAYKISRILLHIDSMSSINYSTAIEQQIYAQICKHGSKALILQVIQIIKYTFEQNDNIFRPQHLKSIYSLITNQNTREDEDIVYSIIEFSQEFIHKFKELEVNIRNIELNEVKQWKQRINYLFLYYESTIRKIEKTNPTLLKEELQLWLFNNEKNRKKLYYNFLSFELKKFSQNSIRDGNYLNLNFDPNNYRKLIFLPWNLKINGSYFPIFIQYKNLEDKLKLKIFMNMTIFNQVTVEQLFIGVHDYTNYIKPKTNYEYEEDNKLRITLQQIKKEHFSKNRPKRMTISKGEIIYFIIFENNIYKIERININIPLTLDTYRPLIHPINFLNLLCRTRYGYQFLKKQKFIQHCLDVIRHQEDQQKYKDQLKGALVSIGTLCGASFLQTKEKCVIYFMESKQKVQIFQLILQKFKGTINYQIQEICLWILNILIKDPKIRQIKSGLTYIQTKKCNWICLPDFDNLHKEQYPRSERIAKKMKDLKQNLPQKPLSSTQKTVTTDDIIYSYLYCILSDKEHNLSQKQEQKIVKQLAAGNIMNRSVIENIIKYISTIDFKPEQTIKVMNLLGPYFCLKFDSHFYTSKTSKPDIDNSNILQLP